MAASKNTTREQRAQELLESGKVALHIGLAVATVEGSRGAKYTVTRQGCNCPDRTRRGEPCKHEIAVRQLCAEFRALKAANERGETVKPSAALMQALRWPVTQPAPAPLRKLPTREEADRWNEELFGAAA